jgi:adenosylcobinamide-GDP ribazoletransferase
VPSLRDNLSLFARQFALALQRATRLPAGAAFAEPAGPDAPAQADLVRTSARHLPGAGAVVGLLSAFVFALVALLLRDNPGGPAVAAVASLLAVLLLTGAAPESALFRLAEAMAPRAGAGGSGHGTIALVVLLAARIACVAALGAVSEAGVLAALLAAPVVSRFTPLLAAHWAAHEPAKDAGTVWVAALWCLVPLALMLLAGGVAFVVLALLAAAAAWVALLRYFRHRPGGFDDARAAALQQVCEAAFYLGASVGA